MKKVCANCLHRLEFLTQIQTCLSCFEHSKWEPLDCCELGEMVGCHESDETITPSIDPDATRHLIYENVWKLLVKTYDRYMQIALTIPLGEDMPDKISDMEIFFNRIIVLGVIEYDKQLKPIEKELGIIK